MAPRVEITIVIMIFRVSGSLAARRGSGRWGGVRRRRPIMTGCITVITTTREVFINGVANSSRYEESRLDMLMARGGLVRGSGTSLIGCLTTARSTDGVHMGLDYKQAAKAPCCTSEKIKEHRSPQQEHSSARDAVVTTVRIESGTRNPAAVIYQ